MFTQNKLMFFLYSMRADCQSLYSVKEKLPPYCIDTVIDLLHAKAADSTEDSTSLDSQTDSNAKGVHDLKSRHVCFECLLAAACIHVNGRL